MIKATDVIRTNDATAQVTQRHSRVFTRKGR